MTPADMREAHLDALGATGADGWLVVTCPKPRADGRTVWPSRAFRPEHHLDAADYAGERDEAGENVYVRAQSLTEHDPTPRRGRSDETGTAVAFALDLDIAGPGHHQTGELPLPATMEAGLEVLAPLPAPSVHLHTGGGAHLWWLLREPERYRPVEMLNTWADRIVGAFNRAGYHVDRPEPARVLRVAGTTRRKVDRATGEKLVNPVTVVGDITGWHHADALLDALPDPPKREAPPAPKRPRRPGAFGPADAVSRLSWSQILEPAGWAFVGMGRMESTPVELWRRPGASSEYSIKCVPDGPAVAWSDACGLPTGRDQRLSKFRVFAHLWHAGDETAAASAVRHRSREVARV